MVDFDPDKQLVHEDNHIIVINKAPSQIVQQDQTNDPSLNEQIKQYLKEKYNKPGNVFLGVVHRLDRPVSGLVVFAKTSKALVRLNNMVKSREINKTYWAIVKNRPPLEKDHLVHYLLKNQEKNKSFKAREKTKGAKRAELEYSLIHSSDNYNLLEIRLITGRHHQIRAQLAAMGCPIKGDVKYGFDRPNKDLAIHLHARKLEIVHPVGQKQMIFTAQPPDDPLWNYFSM